MFRFCIGYQLHSFLLPLPLSLHSSNVTTTCMCTHPTLPHSYPLALTIVKLPCIILPSEGLIVAGTLLCSVVTTTRTCLHSIQGTVQHSGVVDRQVRHTIIAHLFITQLILDFRSGAVLSSILGSVIRNTSSTTYCVYIQTHILSSVGISYAGHGCGRNNW